MLLIGDYHYFCIFIDDHKFVLFIINCIYYWPFNIFLYNTYYTKYHNNITIYIITLYYNSIINIKILHCTKVIYLFLWYNVGDILTRRPEAQLFKNEKSWPKSTFLVFKNFGFFGWKYHLYCQKYSKMQTYLLIILCWCKENQIFTYKMSIIYVVHKLSIRLKTLKNKIDFKLRFV